MQNENDNKGELNFWISYADLMAGLLFVFILLVGAIVIRYVYVQQDLTKKALALGERENTIDYKNKKIEDLKQKLTISDRLLKSSKLDINKLKDLLLDKENENDLLTNRLSDLEQNLVKASNILLLKDDEISALANKLMQKSKEHQVLVDELNITKTKIKNLTGIRIKVVSKLKDKLGDSIAIDSRSGAITFSSNILFNQGQYKLKPNSQKELSKILKKYIHTLLFDPDISKYIEQIIIQGHTNSDGSYLYNLELSQKRALEVMKFLYKSDKENRELYARYLSASGMSYSNLIYNDKGEEDSDRSRRIEIKFRIKNEKAIKELGKFLQR
jgi:chemotaxis protein MotB